MSICIQDLIESGSFEVLNEGADTDRPIEDVFCCDLLSIAMGRGTPGAAWVTVMGNINTLAVMSLADMACIVLAEGVGLDAAAAKKAVEEEITVLATKEPVFRAALAIHRLCEGT